MHAALKAQKAHRQPLQIVLADDNVHVLAMLAETLRTHGYRVECATDGQQALSAIVRNRHSFDLVITDFRMPRMDGIEFIRRARAEDYEGKVIVFASPLSAEDQKRFADLRVDAIIEKPARQKQLLNTVAAIQTALWSHANADAA